MKQLKEKFRNVKLKKNNMIHNNQLIYKYYL